MKTHFEFIHFLDISYAYPHRKTWVHECRNNRSDDLLGLVEWDGRWRQYVFIPCENTIYSAGCLADIQAFVKSLMLARKSQ